MIPFHDSRCTRATPDVRPSLFVVVHYFAYIQQLQKPATAYSQTVDSDELCQAREALWRVLETRRDHRHFLPDPVNDETIAKLLRAFELAPSVGLSQPWHLTVIRDRPLRARIHAGFLAVRERERQRFEGRRRDLYDSLRLEGIRQAPVGIVVSYLPPEEETLGTTSVSDSLQYSVVSAITLLWLAVTAEGLGMGWVSLVEPAELAAAVPLPVGAQPLAYLCIGHPERALTEPLLHSLGWKKRRPVVVDWI